VPGAGRAGELAFGTIDCFLLWRLTGGQVHATDVTNAARTMLYDIHRQAWDEDLCRLLRVPMAILPQVHDNAHVFGTTAPGLFDAAIPIAGMAGDQQAALFGQACFAAGQAKSTYGTGCFMLLNTGETAFTSRSGLLTTPACRIDGRMTYALEGSIFVAGAAVKWLRDGIGVITHARDTNDMATQVPDSHGVYMVPAFAGLGAPYWDPDARGAIFGLTLGSTQAHLARAALEAVGYQTLDLARTMEADGARYPAALRVDGGMAANDWLCQFLADLLETPVERPAHLETTALAAFLPGWPPDSGRARRNSRPPGHAAAGSCRPWRRRGATRWWPAGVMPWRAPCRGRRRETGADRARPGALRAGCPCCARARCFPPSRACPNSPRRVRSRRAR
jgi:glycerol kinase